MQKEPRWKLRLQSFEKAFKRLEDAVKLGRRYSPLELAGLVKTFEFTWELAWQTLKDLLEHEGHEVAGPREALKKGFKNGLLNTEASWLDLLESRNLMAHVYDEDKSSEISEIICNRYFGMLQNLLKTLQDKL